jgi:hypothetical protein
MFRTMAGATVALKFCKEKGGLNEFWREASLMRYTPSQQMRKNVIK